MVKRLLVEFKKTYPINYAVVLAYFPSQPEQAKGENFCDTILPDGIENVPRRFSINYRNRWMIERSDYVITYVQCSVGGASKFKQLAERKKKIVINLAEPDR